MISIWQILVVVVILFLFFGDLKKLQQKIKDIITSFNYILIKIIIYNFRS